MNQQLAVDWADGSLALQRGGLDPIESLIDAGSPATYRWDIPQTIPQLAYLTHNYFRYYGKFPPVIPRRLLAMYRPPDGQWVLDNFSGSGTTLVEALLVGVPAIGTDVSSLAALAGRVKTTLIDPLEIRGAAAKLLKDAQGASTSGVSLPPAKTIEKWFSEESVDGLASIKGALMRFEPGPIKEFLALAFLGIVRRVSRAYDGEVRPHINATKRPRDVAAAMARKLDDMASRMALIRAEAVPGTPVRSLAADARDLSAVLPDALGQVGLAISHPPYLNCFDYAPVFRLEYEWSCGMEDVGLEWSYDEIRRREIKAWPAATRELVDGYFGGVKEAYEQVRTLMAPGGRCCVVIGDATRRGEVIDVFERFTQDMTTIGFQLDRTILRSTNYGTGKYAYADRADYHGDRAVKRDGILIFKAV